MGFMFAMGPCGACKSTFSFNPELVPSFRFDGENREPICKSCMDLVNSKRKKQGLSPHQIMPGAYDPGECV